MTRQATAGQATGAGGVGGPAIDERTVVVPTLRLPTCYDPDQFTRVAPWRSMVNWDVHVQLYDQLLRYPIVEQDGRPVQDITHFDPMLAEGFDVSDDGTRYRVRLRPGVTSEHGNELTAEDVVWSWAALDTPADAPAPPALNWLSTGVHGEVGRWVAFMGSAYEGIPGAGACAVRALDRHTVEFALPEPNAAFPHILTMTIPPIYDSTEAKRHATADDPFARDWLAEHPGGFGRYTVESRSDDELVLRARADHYAGTPAIERVVYRVPADGRDRVEALLASEIDVSGSLATPRSGSSRRRATRSSRCRWTRASLRSTTCTCGGRWPPRCRTARSWTRCCTVTPARGAASCRRRVSAISSCSPESRTSTGRVPRWRHPAGPTCAPRCTTARATRMPLAIAGGGHRCNEMSYAVPHDFGDRYFGITNWIDYQNPGVNERILEIRRTHDPDRRLELIHETQRIVAEDQPWAFIAQPNFLIAHRAGLEGFAWRSRSGNRLAYYDLAWRATQP
jgi:ABC-type transport system substrate-binding protein